MGLGSLCHFLYAWSGGSRWVGLITAVNESTWEHLKLLFFPTLLYTMLQALLSAVPPGYCLYRALGLCAGLLSIVLLFYTYSGVLGRNYLFCDILTFFIGVGVTFGVSARLQYAQPAHLCASAGPLLWALLSIAFFSFTCHPPHIALFEDPNSHKYGFPQRR